VVDAANLRDGAADPFPLELAPPVEVALERMTGTPKGRAWAQGAIAARASWATLVEGALAEAGLPPELAAVPLVESGYTNWGDPAAPSSQSLAPGIAGRGLWMFIAPTARAYGLRVEGAVDERLDPAKETAAAVALLGDLYQRYGDWRLALAGYNQGERAVDAAISAGGTRDVWSLVGVGALNDYVPQVMAAAILLEEPALVGR
jgi:hypothetical protein